MAYRIEATAPVGEEVRRVLGEQLREATEDLARPTEPGAAVVGSGPDEEAIHSARKQIKKARSLLRLARADLGTSVVRQAHVELREVAARLATQREADAAVEVAQWLETASSETEGEQVAGVAELISLLQEEAEAGRTQGALSWAAARSVAIQLARTATWLEGLPSHGSGWDALEPGLRRQYARGRDALADLAEQPTADELHEWRKRVKDLWYHQRLLRRLWPDVQRPIVVAAEELSELLGTDHDLALLEARLSAQASPAGAGAPWSPNPEDADVQDARGGGGAAVEPLRGLSPEHRHALLLAIGRQRRRLQGQARRLGFRLYADRPEGWAGRHGAWWDAARNDAESAPDREDDRPVGEDDPRPVGQDEPLPPVRPEQPATAGTA